MLKIGLTSGIGSGKSLVTGIFKVLGIPVFDADLQAKLLMESDAQLINDIKVNFGEESYHEHKLNKTYLAAIVFSNPVKLEILNSLVHPAVILAAENWMSVQTSPYVIKEAAIMFESGTAAHLDYIIGVQSPLSLRILRTMKRDNITREEVLLRIDKQISDTIKMKLCDFVIINDEQQLLIPQILKLHKQFLSMSV